MDEQAGRAAAGVAGASEARSAPATAELGRGAFYDGVTSRRHEVLLRSRDGLAIIEDGTVLATWPFESVRRVQGRDDRLVLHAQGAPELARLEVSDAATAAALGRLFPALDGPGAGREASALRIVLWSLAAGASVILVIIFLVPILAEKLVGFVPPAFEERLGAAADAQLRSMLGGKVCRSPKGNKAFDILLAKLRQATPGAPVFTLEVWNSPIVNAFALPGGKVRVFRGLLEQTRSPDELAGVLAHEMGHVTHRDGLKALMRSTSTGYLLGLFFGDVAGAGVLLGAGKAVLDASYSREAEASADDEAARTLAALGRPAAPLGEFLVRVTGPGGTEPSFLDTHPASRERLDRLKAFSSASGPPLLDETQWKALVAICKSE